MDGFESINDDQFEVLTDAIAWITVLIAGSDGKIDQQEKDWAVKLTKIRGYGPIKLLNPFYDKVGENFADKLEALIASLPNSSDERTKYLTDKLAQVNDILPCIDNDYAVTLYESYLTFAEHVAKASGGFLGMMSVSKKEAALIKLDMITPITFTEEEEEE